MLFLKQEVVMEVLHACSEVFPQLKTGGLLCCGHVNYISVLVNNYG